MRPKSSYFDSQKISTFRTAKSWHLSGLEFLLRKWKKSFFCGYSALVSPINFVMAMLQNFGKGQVCGRGSAPSVQKIFRTDRALLLQEIKSLVLWFFPYRYFNLPNGIECCALRTPHFSRQCIERGSAVSYWISKLSKTRKNESTLSQCLRALLVEGLAHAVVKGTVLVNRFRTIGEVWMWPYTHA